MKKLINLASISSLFLSTQLGTVKLAEAGSAYVDCGGMAFPKGIVQISSTIMLLLQIVVPLIIIVMGSFDILKATASKDQKQILQNQKLFVKRLIIAVVAFLIVSIVQLLVTAVSSSSNLANCVKCITQGVDKCNGEVESPTNPSYPPDSEFKFDSSKGFIQHPLRAGAYGNDGSNSPSGTPTKPGSNVTGDVLQYGSGKNGNETAAPVGTTVTPAPKGPEYKAKFTAYYPEDSALQGGFNDCKGFPLQPSKQTCAAPKSVPYGSIVYINSLDGSEYQDYVGRPYVVTDTGGAINILGDGTYRIDLLFPNKTTAYAFGIRTGKIIIVQR